MDLPSYTRGKTTYYDTAGLSFSESMAVAFQAGLKGFEVFDSTQMDCPKWVEQMVLARRRREAKANEFARARRPSQEDVFKPKMLRIDSEPSPQREAAAPAAPPWTCDYCGKSNDAQEPVCRGCGAPNPQGETSTAASKKIDVFMDAVVSSVIAAIGYDEYAKRLVVRFKSGAAYEYLNIPKSLYVELMASEAKGKFYSANIRGKFDGRKL